MKIGDVKVGEHYAALDSPGSVRDALPREVEALEIVKVEEHYYPSGHGMFHAPRATRKVSRVKIKTLGPQQSDSSWGRDHLAASEEGTVLTVPAKQLVGRWADLKQGIQDRVEREAAERKARDEIERRLNALLGEDAPYVGGGRNPVVRFDGPELLRILELAEKGAEIERNRDDRAEHEEAHA